MTENGEPKVQNPAAQNLTREGFCDEFGSFQGGDAGSYLSGSDQADTAESPKSAQKPSD